METARIVKEQRDLILQKYGFNIKVEDAQLSDYKYTINYIFNGGFTATIYRNTKDELISNDVVSYTDDGKHFWNLAIRTSGGYTKEDLIQESTLYIEDDGLREATFEAIKEAGLRVEKGENNNLIVTF